MAIWIPGMEGDLLYSAALIVACSPRTLPLDQSPAVIISFDRASILKTRKFELLDDLIAVICFIGQRTVETTLLVIAISHMKPMEKYDLATTLQRNLLDMRVVEVAMAMPHTITTHMPFV